MAYNMSAFGNATNIYEMAVSMNTASNNLIGILAILGVFIILLVTLMRRNPPAESFFSASAVTSVWSLLLFGAGLTGVEYFVGTVVITAFSAAGLYIKNKT